MHPGGASYGNGELGLPLGLGVGLAVGALARLLAGLAGLAIGALGLATLGLVALPRRLCPGLRLGLLHLNLHLDPVRDGLGLGELVDDAVDHEAGDRGDAEADGQQDASHDGYGRCGSLVPGHLSSFLLTGLYSLENLDTGSRVLSERHIRCTTRKLVVKKGRRRLMWG